MSLDNFINDPYGYDKGDSGQVPVIARASIWPAWKLVSYGETNYFEYKYNKEDELETKKMAQAKAGNDKNAFISAGILTTIYAEDAIQYMFDTDYYSFVLSYHSQEKFKPSKKDYRSEYLPTLQKLIADGGPFPYDVVYNAIIANQAVFENTVYCKLVQVVDEVSKAQGKENSKGYPFQFFVVEKVYDSREAALTDNEIDEVNPISQGEVDLAFDGSSLSKLALENYRTIELFQKSATSILGGIDAERMKLMESNNDLAFSEANQLATKKVAGDWGIEPADVDLLENEVPF